MNKNLERCYLMVIWLTLSFFLNISNYIFHYLLFIFYLTAGHICVSFQTLAALNEYTSRYLQQNMFVANVFFVLVMRFKNSSAVYVGVCCSAVNFKKAKMSSGVSPDVSGLQFPSVWLSDMRQNPCSQKDW